ncbi:HNH endonuclease [Mycobacterium avium]|nr:HNH endonuclease [Mycobacterium avium]
MCGKTPLEDGVKLVVDHKIPKAWGGTDDPENLQPLCVECNAGKKDLFETYNEFTPQIRQAATCDEPQRRIGELLLAFRGEWVPSDLIGIVASAKEYQEDWQRRLRDLRYIGWDFAHKKQREGGRVRTYYRLVKSAPWPKNIQQAIKAEFDRRSAVRRRRR